MTKQVETLFAICGNLKLVLKYVAVTKKVRAIIYLHGEDDKKEIKVKCADKVESFCMLRQVERVVTKCFT
jgi:hypothetical protein